MEQVLPPQTEEGAGFEPARVHQFTVFLENRVGRLQSLLRAMEEGGSAICALAIEESADIALIRIVCCKPDLARETFRTGGYAFGETELLAIELPRRGDKRLIDICTALLAAEINIRYTYPFLRVPRGPALAMYVDDASLAAQLLMRKGFRLLADSDLNF